MVISAYIAVTVYVKVCEKIFDFALSKQMHKEFELTAGRLRIRFKKYQQQRSADRQAALVSKNNISSSAQRAPQGEHYTSQSSAAGSKPKSGAGRRRLYGQCSSSGAHRAAQGIQNLKVFVTNSIFLLCKT